VLRNLGEEIVWPAASTAVRAHGWAGLGGLGLDDAALAPFEVPANVLRPVVALSVNYPYARVQRHQTRAALELPMSRLLYSEVRKLLRPPAVYETTGLIISPAAITQGPLRIMQARILGLKRATEAECAARDSVRAARASTKGRVTGTDRVSAIKTFRGAKPPVRGFRLGDVHIRPHDGVLGKCIGHHLWSYDDGARVRAGLAL